jgi:hypothetical protein
MNCIRFVWRRRIRIRSELYALVDWLRPFVDTGKLKILQAAPPFDRIGDQWPMSDLYVLVFRCFRCEREFQLVVDAYHGRGGWK